MSPLLAHEPWFFPLLAATHVVLLVCWLYLLHRLYRRYGSIRRPLLVTAGAVMAWAVVGPELLYRGLPVSWFTPLQEGDGLHAWQLLQVEGLHAGPGYLGFWMALFGPVLDGSRTILSLHAWFGGLDVLLLGGAVACMTRPRWLGLFWVALVCVTRPWLDASLSDQLATLTAAYVFPSLTAGYVLADPERRTRSAWIATVCLLAATIGVATVRVELSAMPLAALVGGWLGWWRRARQARLPGPVWRWSALIAWVGVSVLVARYQLASFPMTRGLPSLRWVFMGLYPFNVSWLVALGVALASMPLGLTALSTWGAWRGLRSGGPALFGVAALLALANAFHAAAHGAMLGSTRAVSPYEMYRYTLLLFMPWMVLAAMGWEPAWQRLRERVGRRRATGLLMLACVLPPWPGLLQWLPNQQALWEEVGPAPTLPLLPWRRIDRDHQRDFHLARRRFEQADACVHVMRVRPWFGAERTGPVWGLALRQRGSRRVLVRQVPVSDRPVAEVVREVWPDARCARLHVGLDCNTVPDLACGDDLEGTELLETSSWAHLPFIHPEHGRVYREELQTSLYALPLPDRP